MSIRPCDDQDVKSKDKILVRCDEDANVLNNESPEYYINYIMQIQQKFNYLDNLRISFLDDSCYISGCRPENDEEQKIRLESFDLSQKAVQEIKKFFKSELKPESEPHINHIIYCLNHKNNVYRIKNIIKDFKYMYKNFDFNFD